VAESLPSVCKALGSISITEKTKQNKQATKNSTVPIIQKKTEEEKSTRVKNRTGRKQEKI
jgi:hypothetical protein